ESAKFLDLLLRLLRILTLLLRPGALPLCLLLLILLILSVAVPTIFLNVIVFRVHTPLLIIALLFLLAFVLLASRCSHLLSALLLAPAAVSYPGGRFKSSHRTRF